MTDLPVEKFGGARLRLGRRDALKGLFAAAGFGAALPGGRLFAAPEGWTPPGEPELVFGVISDTHLRTSYNGRTPGKNWPVAYFRAALEFFRDAGVDAIMHCGDFAHRGQVAEMQFHADVWNKVFAGRTAPVKLFATGNHDVQGAGYGDFVKKLFPDETERAKHVFANDTAAHWERIWGEKYEGVWHKEVKGFHFFGRHYEVPVEAMHKKILECARPLGLKGAKPFFFVQHRIPPRAQRYALRGFPNAMAFFGHWHHSNADWRTAIHNRFPLIQCASCRPRGDGVVVDGCVAKTPLLGREDCLPSREGLVVKVYPGVLAIERREFGASHGAKIGPDWVMPFGRYRPHPLSRDELKKAVGEPQFGKNATLQVENVKSESGGNAVKISIPRADGDPASRAYAYEVVVVGDADAPKLFKSVYARGCNLAKECETTTFAIPAAELPKGGRLTVAVRPVTSLGTAGRPMKTVFEPAV